MANSATTRAAVFCRSFSCVNLQLSEAKEIRKHKQTVFYALDIATFSFIEVLQAKHRFHILQPFLVP